MLIALGFFASMALSMGGALSAVLLVASQERKKGKK